jgi:hypothetical protein
MKITKLLSQKHLQIENKHDVMLALCCSKDSRFPMFNTPFLCDDYIVSTNMHLFAFTNRCNSNFVGQSYNGLNSAYQNWITKNKNYNNKIITKGLGEWLSNYTVDDFEEIGSNIECEECDATGQVEFQYYSSEKRTTFDINANCPICSGCGLSSKTSKKPNNLLTFQPYDICDIKGKLIALKYLSLVYISAVLFHQDIIECNPDMENQNAVAFKTANMEYYIGTMLQSENYNDNIKFTLL